MSQVHDPDSIARAAEAQRIRRARLPAVLDYAFRPMFLAAGSWAVIALALWLAMFFGYVQLPSRFDPLAWHVHEMLFGFVMAAVAGFLLTAIPNWTGRLPVRGLRLAALAGLWLLGRLACLISADMPTCYRRSGVSDGPSRRRRPRNHHRAQLAQPADDSASRALHCCRPADAPRIARLRGTHRPWLAPRRGSADSADLRDRRAHHSELHAQLAVQAQEPASSFTPEHARYRGGRRACGGAHPLGVSPRPSRDRRAPAPRSLGQRRAAQPLDGCRAEKLLFILHVGYTWLVLGVLLLGLSIFNIGVPVASAIHALTAGAIAVMILAVMPRVTLGHTGRELTANRATVAVFVLINAAAVARVCASWHTEAMTILLLIAGVCWITAFGLFEIVYGPMLLTRRAAS